MCDFIDLEELRSLLRGDITVQDAVDILTGSAVNDDDLGASGQVDIYIEPPEPALQSPEDSGNEDDEVRDILHLPGQQLLAPAEIVIGSERIGGQFSEHDERDINVVSDLSADASNSSGQSCVDPRLTKRLRERKPSAQWIEGDFHEAKISFPKEDYSQFSGSPVDVFEKFFTDEVWELLVTETNKYAVSKNAQIPPTSVEEMKCFFGVLILSGYNNLPTNRDYWDQLPDMHNELVSDAIRKNSFVSLLRYLHCASIDEMNPNDKGWKLRKYMNLIKNRCLVNFVPKPDLNYDESMVRYFGRHPMKQFIRNKPVLFGYKMWALNSSDGYLVNFDLYQGKTQNIHPIHAKLFGKCTAPFISMIDELPAAIRT